MGEAPGSTGCPDKADKKAQPTYGIIDSQSVKTTGPAQERGIDGGKKRKDEKDTL